MPTKGLQQPPQDTIDLLEYLNLLKANIIMILLCGIFAGYAGNYYVTHRVTPVYQASINLIVNANVEATTVVTISDVNSAASLVDTYAVVIKSNRVLDRVVEELQLPYSWAMLNNKVSVRAVNETSVMEVAVKDSDPDEAMRIVLKISEVAPGILVQAVHAGSCEIVSDAYTSGTPISPNIRRFTQTAFLAGAVAFAGMVCLLHLLNNTVADDEELKQLLDVPVLGVIPEVNGQHGHEYRREK